MAEVGTGDFGLSATAVRRTMRQGALLSYADCTILVGRDDAGELFARDGRKL